MTSNPFDSAGAALLYAEGRPDYSQLASDAIRRLTRIESPVDCAVDVGCGTGISTRAIAPFACSVIGVDASQDMLASAAEADNVTYLLGSAEGLPIDDRSCDLISVGSALHWFDQTRFLAEAARIARPDAWLVVFDHWFTGTMSNNDAFGDWARDVYLATYPSPPRDRSWRPPADLGEWRHVGWERYDHPVSFFAEQLATYLLTQSNLQTAIASGARTHEQLRSWILKETAPFFAESQESVFMFGGFVACHRRSG